MSAGSAVLQTPENENGGVKRMPCPLYGCKRVYTDTSALESHIKDHEIPAQSLPGKVLRCSASGCAGAFPSMQKLMEHMRQHHKPNIYFQCESCRTKLRTYKNLLGHLHTCSKVPRGKPKAAEATPPPPTTQNASNTNPKSVEQAPPQLEWVSSVQQVPPQIANSAGSPPGAGPQPSSSEPPVLGPPILPLQEPSLPKFTPPQLSDAASQPPGRIEASTVPPPVNPAAPKAAPDVQSQFQMQSQSPEAVHPAPGPATASPPASWAVWKKSQGMACNRRVLWEHTRGRYTCVQCGHTVTNRKEMNQHIKNHHSGKAAENTGSSATSS